jgi:molybdopterin converting factor small subunit
VDEGKVMKIYVKLYATLRQYIPTAGDLTRVEGLDVDQGTTVAEIMEMFAVPQNLKVLALVNGVHCTRNETPLKEGDTLLFYPLMSGG